MSVIDFIWNSDQESRLTKLEKQIAEQNKRIKILKEWIDYLYQQQKTQKLEK